MFNAQRPKPLVMEIVLQHDQLYPIEAVVLRDRNKCRLLSLSTSGVINSLANQTRISSLCRNSTKHLWIKFSQTIWEAWYPFTAFSSIKLLYFLFLTTPTSLHTQKVDLSHTRRLKLKVKVFRPGCQMLLSLSIQINKRKYLKH